MPADYHTHTPLCRHAVGEPEAYVEAAVGAGLSAYGVADHAPVLPGPFDDWRMDAEQLPAYFAWVERARSHAAGRIPVRLGLECDWLPDGEAGLETLRAAAAWDYWIGSVHYLRWTGGGQWDFDNPKWLGRWSEVEVDDVWGAYWKTYGEMAASGWFEICGHPDLVKKFGRIPRGDLDRFYEPAIDAVAAAGCAIELNTAGWHKPCSECYPAPRFLELACSAGIPLVISSDAHAPEEVGRDFAKAVEIARVAGYRETATFEQRRRSFEALGTA